MPLYVLSPLKHTRGGFPQSFNVSPAGTGDPKNSLTTLSQLTNPLQAHAHKMVKLILVQVARREIENSGEGDARAHARSVTWEENILVLRQALQNRQYSLYKPSLIISCDPVALVNHHISSRGSQKSLAFSKVFNPVGRCLLSQFHVCV